MENNLPIDIKNLNPSQNIIFLDVDGVLNHELFYERNFKYLQQYNKIPLYKTVKKLLKKLVKKKKIATQDIDLELCKKIALKNKL